MNTNRLTGTQQERPNYEFLQNVKVDGNVEVVGDIIVDDITIDELTCNLIKTDEIQEKTTNNGVLIDNSTLIKDGTVYSDEISNKTASGDLTITTDSTGEVIVDKNFKNYNGVYSPIITNLTTNYIKIGDSSTVDLSGVITIKQNSTLEFEDAPAMFISGIPNTANFTGTSSDIVCFETDGAADTNTWVFGDSTTKQGVYYGTGTSSIYKPSLWFSISYSTSSKGGYSSGGTDSEDNAIHRYVLRNADVTDTGSSSLLSYVFQRRENNGTGQGAIVNRPLWKINNHSSTVFTLGNTGAINISGGLTCGTVSCSDITSNSETTYQLTVSNLGNGTVRLPSYDNTGESSLTPAAGDMYFNTDLGKLKFYNGSSWETVTSA